MVSGIEGNQGFVEVDKCILCDNDLELRRSSSGRCYYQCEYCDFSFGRYSTPAKLRMAYHEEYYPDECDYEVVRVLI